MSSISGDDGTSSITVTFEQGYNVDIAAVDVLSRVSIAEPQLPDAVRQTGVSVNKQSSGVVLGMPFYAEDDRYDEEFISNYLDLYVLDRLRRIEGVAELEPFGERRLAMRIWLDPDRLASRDLTAQDVVNALEEQNLQVGAGNIGQPPAPDGQMYQLSLEAIGRLKEVSEFGDIVLKTGAHRTLIKIKDVGRVELGAENYNTFARWNGKPAIGYQIRQTPGGASNALEIAKAVKAELAQIKQNFPPRLNYEFPYDPTQFIVESRMDRAIDLMRRSYQSILYWIMNFKLVVLALFVASLGVTGWLYTNVPTAFLPDEDQGLILNIMQGPDGISLGYTQQVTSQIEQKVLNIPEARGVFTIGGLGFSGSNPNNAIVFAPLKSWSDRARVEQSQQGIIERLTEPLSQILKANVISTGLPAIQGLGNFGGFVLQLQDRGDNELSTLIQFRDELVARANERPELQEVFSTYTASSPKLQIEINRDRAKALQVRVDDILNTLQSFLGSRYVNDFNAYRRTYRVYIQAVRQFRSNPEDIGQLYVRSQLGEMIPLSNLVQVNSITGAQTINHYNLFRAIEINGSAAPGYSSDRAIAVMEELAEEILPNNIGYEWSGISLEEVESGGQAPLIFGLGILFVFLVLAAQYENFVDPFIILLTVPLAVLGALLAQSLQGLPNDVYCQVGLIMLIGLASKNAILIVEFANQLRDRGLPLVKATVEAAQQRLRPIIMTAVSTSIGIFPLTIATFLSLLVVPILNVVIAKMVLLLKIQTGRETW